LHEANNLHILDQKRAKEKEENTEYDDRGNEDTLSESETSF